MNPRNLVALHRHQAEQLGPLPALRFKRHGLYHDLTWEHYREQALAGAAAFVEAGIAPGDRVGLVAENRVEWLVADLAIMAAAAVNVPPHAPLTARQIHFQLADAGVRWLIVSTRAQADKVRQVRADLPELRGVLAFDRDATGDGILCWQAFLQRGRQALLRLRAELRRREEQLGPDDLATIMYTSGTTGNPKGVMLTHGNLLSNAIAMNQLVSHPPGDVVLNWLPFSHIYARTVDHYGALVSGVLTCLAESGETVIENLEEVWPTHMSSVPRLYEKVLTAVACDDPARLGRRLRDLFGPRIDWLTSGGAPLPVAVAHAFQDAGLLILQGYGLTESSPVISFNRREHYKLETVGQALPGVEIAIGPDGEVLTRGPHVMKGYWKNPQATAEAIRDGWLHTGDLGSLDAEGFLTITGRKKELLVLSNGKKVVPGYLEGLLLVDPCIDQAVIYGEGKNFLTALIVPQWEQTKKVLASMGVQLPWEDEDQLSHHPAVQEFFQQRIAVALQDVSNWEQVKKIVVRGRPFSVAADEMTVSLKLRRNVVFDRHRAELEKLYQE